MDEPNSALNAAESERLFELLRRLRDRGITIIYVSHRLEEVFAIADRITVIRDGKYQWTRPIVETSIPDVIAAMIGRRLEETFPDRHPVDPAAPVVLEIRDLTCPPTVGQSTSRSGPARSSASPGSRGPGSTRRCTCSSALANRPRRRGLSRHVRGSAGITVRGNPARVRPDPRKSSRRRADDRVVDPPQCEPLRPRRLARPDRLVDRTQERNLAEGYVRQLNVATDSIDKRVVNLSGGNQQKVVVAKWLATEPTI
jgi:ribose transport system ATP-binding protein